MLVVLYNGPVLPLMKNRIKTKEIYSSSGKLAVNIVSVSNYL